VAADDEWAVTLISKRGRTPASGTLRIPPHGVRRPPSPRARRLRGARSARGPAVV